MEGWCSLLLMDQRKWRKVWVVISSRSPQQQPLTIRARKRFSLLTALQNFAAPVMHDGPYIQISSTNSERHVRNPIVLVKSVTQATAVYPDKRELIPTSSILRVEGRFSSGPDVTEADEREGACLLMPDSRQGITESENLIKWLTGTVFTLHFAGLTDDVRSCARYLWLVRSPSRMVLGSSQPEIPFLCVSFV